MGKVEVIYFQEADGKVPVLEWISILPERAQAKLATVIELLEESGHEMRRPLADYLRDNIYELRAKLQHTNYRILYGFHGRSAVVLVHGLTKQRASVPDRDIDLACKRLRQFSDNPSLHTYHEED
jgi:phage-related protein